MAPHLPSASTSCSTILFAHFQPYRWVRQHSSHTMGSIPRYQRGLLLDSKLQNGSTCVKHLSCSFHGDAKTLKQQRPWEKFKDAFNLYPTREPKRTLDVLSFNRPFGESHRTPGNYPSLVTQLAGALEPHFPSESISQSKARDLNRPGNLDQRTSSSALEAVQLGWKVSSKSVPTLSTILEHRRSRRAEKSTSEQRTPSSNNGRPGPKLETIYMRGKQPLPRRSNRIASTNLNSNFSKQSKTEGEWKNVMSNQTVRRSPDGGAHLLSNSHATQMSYTKSETRVDEACIVVDQARSSRNNCQILASRVVRSAQFPQTRAGAARWREASKMIEHIAVGGIGSCQQKTDFLKVENLSRSITAKDVLEIREPALLSIEEEERSSAISEGVTDNSARQDLIPEVVLRKALWMDGRSTPAWMKAGLSFVAQGRLESRASDGRRACSRDTGQGNSSTHMHSAGTTSEAIAVLQNRLQKGITTDSNTYVKVLQMCLKQKDLLSAKQVHDCIIQSGKDKNTYVANNLLNVYIRCGGFSDARRVFDELNNRSVVTWNTMIAGYVRSDDAESAMELFKLMRQDGARPTEVTYLCILKACASPLALPWGKKVHEFIRQAGFQSDVRVGTALLHMYAKCGCITEARRVFENLSNRNTVTWTIMIGAYAERGDGVEAYRLFLEMRRQGFEPDAFTYASILNASASAGALVWVKEVHAHASKAGLESDLRVGNALVHMYAKCGSVEDARLVFDRIEKRDVVSWTVMIGGLAQHGCGHEAYRLFLRMRREGFEPDAFTFASILNAPPSAGNLEWVKEVHGQARKAALESDLRVGNALVHMYAESGSIDDARLVFDRMEKRDVVTWTSMIGGLAHHGCGHEALALFKQMNAELVKPDATTFVAMLSACCHGGLIDDGRRLFSAMMQDYGIEPTVVHYNCMVDLLGRAGHLEEAKLFISNMPVEPNVVIWTALLGACRTYGNVELGEFAANELFKLEPNKASTYVLLSNIYAAAGKWEKVSLVRAVMQQIGFRKEPGRSWIEVDNKIHDFVVGDTSHPEAKAIYTELNKLTEKLKAEGYVPDTRLVLHDTNEEDKELAICCHSEKLAITYGLMRIPRGEPIRVWKNLRVCPDCHTATKFISKVTGREIIARDANRFHHFKGGVCSCGDYW